MLMMSWSFAVFNTSNISVASKLRFINNKCCFPLSENISFADKLGCALKSRFSIFLDFHRHPGLWLSLAERNIQDPVRDPSEAGFSSFIDFLESNHHPGLWLCLAESNIRDPVHCSWWSIRSWTTEDSTLGIFPIYRPTSILHQEYTWV